MYFYSVSYQVLKCTRIILIDDTVECDLKSVNKWNLVIGCIALVSRRVFEK